MAGFGRNDAMGLKARALMSGFDSGSGPRIGMNAPQSMNATQKRMDQTNPVNKANYSRANMVQQTPGFKKGGPVMGKKPIATVKNGGSIKGKKLTKATINLTKDIQNKNLDDDGQGPATTMKKGGKVHSDAAQDKKLIGQMINAAEKKEGPEMKRGGKVKGYAAGGVAKIRHGVANAKGSPVMTPKKNRVGAIT